MLRHKKPVNIYFNKQISRNEAVKSYKIATQDYTYDYTVVKPKASWMCKFDKITGRRKGLAQTPGAYSYTHYDYDQHSWGNNSNVFRNTKAGVMSFEKQTYRKA